MGHATKGGLLKRLILLTAIILVISACGDSDSSDTTEASETGSTETTEATEMTEAPAETTAAPADAPLFVAINKSADQSYFIDLQAGFTAKIEELGGEALVFDAKLDPNLGVNLVNDAIAAGAKGIAITVPDQTIGPAISTAANDAGVALVATDDVITDADGASIPFVGFNGVDMGTKVGAEAARLLTESGWLDDSSVTLGVLSTEVQTLSVCNDRTDAARGQVAAAGVSEDSFFAVPYPGDAAAAQDAAGPVITAHPDVTHWIVFACNDEGVLGTLNALSTAGAKPENVIGVGLGAYEACKPWAAGQDSGFKGALYISGIDVGEAAATALWENVVNGTELPAESVANTTIVGPDTYADLFECGT